ncbi:collagenase [Carboxylicivirga sp. N1Y90]|uniref:collagenase n=1 Tax=Carboxylicivirga fragile TaxID=3417571 RepID=UPI003D3279BF|nr:collagenase [Marinilabiliaceae bacterium N1Y90]
MKSKLLYQYLHILMKPLFVSMFLVMAICANAQQRPISPCEDHGMECSRSHHHHQKSKLKSSSKKSGIEPMDPRIRYKSFEAVGGLKATKAACSYSTSDIASMGVWDLVNFLETTTDYECIGRPLFAYSSSDTRRIFSESNMTTVFRQAKDAASAYDGTYSSGLYGYLVYMHVARFMEFFHSDDVSLNSYHEQDFNAACEELSRNIHLFDQNEEAYNVLYEYLVCLDNDGLRHQQMALDVVTGVFNNLSTTQSWKSINDSQLLREYGKAYNQGFFLLFRGTGSETGGDDDFWSILPNNQALSDALAKVALDDELLANEDLAFIVKNAVTELTRMAHVPNEWPIIEDHIIAVAQKYERLSIQWVNAVLAINKYGDCVESGLCMTREALVEELEDYLFPNRYKFDDGKLVFKSPMDADKAQNLYHAVKQVQAQFFKIAQTDVPVDGDVNDVLNLIVFGNNDQYVDYAPFLYGITTNNGGMYIERSSTFYTFDREYGLSLESLFRHEYVHYLQGRYWIPGYWGDNPFYDNNRLVWFEEGGAELFAGSTDTDGIKLLAQSGSRIKNEVGSFPSLSTLLNASYDDGDFIHYRYGNAFWYSMYMNNYNQLHELISLARADNISGFDALIDPLKSSSSANADFQAFLNSIADETITYWEPSTSWMSDRELHVGNPEAILNEWMNAGGVEATASIDAESLNGRFRLEGTMPTTGTDKELAANVEELLSNVRENGTVNNLDYTVAYLKNYSNNSADFVISGPLRNKSIVDEVNADFKSNTQATVAGAEVAFENKSTGYSETFTWNMPGATPATSTDANPLVVYNTPGTYEVSLSVTGKDGSQDVETKSDYITIYAVSDQTYCEATVQEDYTFISRFKIANIDHSSYGFTNQGYQDNSATVCTELQKGESYDFVMECDTWYEKAVAVWFDFNQDGDFDDANEEVYSVVTSEEYEVNGSISIPESALEGGTRMRVRLSHSNTFMDDPMPPCGLDSYMGEVEDYSVVIVNHAPAVPAPVAKFSSDFNNIIRGETINFEDLSENEPISREWTFEGGEPSTSTAQNPSVIYREDGIFLVTLKVTNASGSDTKLGYIEVAKGGGTDGVYCIPSNDRNDVYITNVNLGDIDNTSDFGTDGYNDFRSLSTEVKNGSEYSISVTTSNSWTYNTIKAWVDWNQDGDFSDLGEEILYDGHQYVTQDVFAGAFEVPMTAKQGGTIMRVRLAYSVDPSPCTTNAGIGETEDYVLVVKSESIAPSIPSGLYASNITSEGFMLSWIASSDNVGVIAYEITCDNKLVATVSASELSYELSGLNFNTEYDLQVSALDAAGNKSALSDVLKVLTATPTDLEEVDDDAIFSIYPNPNNGKFTVLLPQAYDDTQVSIISTNGKVMKQVTTSAHVLEINMPSLESGVYIIEVKTVMETLTQKLIVL